MLDTWATKFDDMVAQIDIWSSWASGRLLISTTDIANLAKLQEIKKIWSKTELSKQMEKTENLNICLFCPLITGLKLAKFKSINSDWRFKNFR